MEQRSTPVRLSSAMSGVGNKPRTLARDISESLGKLPPQALDLEEAILGAALLQSNECNEVISIIRPEDFYSDQHKEIFQAVVDLHNQNLPVDMRTVVAELRKSGKLEVAGGAYYIAQLTSKVSSAANVEYHCRLLLEFKIKREIILTASTAHHLAYEDTSDALQILDSIQQQFDSIGGKYLKGNFKSASELSNQFHKNLISKRGKQGLTGIPTGLSRLDRITGGWQNSDLIVIAGRPGMSKSSLMLQCGLNEAIRFNVPVGIFSLEMSSEQLIARAHCSEAEINTERVFMNYIDDFELMKIGEVSDKIKNSPLYIDDTAAITLFEFRARVRRLVHEKNIKAVYVDFIQMMKLENEKGMTREQVVSTITNGLKQVAKELNIPIIAIASMNRGTETRGGDRRPQLSDIRESGQIESSADLILLIYRPEYYKIMETEDGHPTQGLMEVIVAKHRNGSLDTIPLKFIGKYTKVTDWDSVPQKQESLAPNLRPLNSGYRLPYSDDAKNNSGDDIPF